MGRNHDTKVLKVCLVHRLCCLGSMLSQLGRRTAARRNLVGYAQHLEQVCFLHCIQAGGLRRIC